jgi:hypothetical protein
VCNVRSAARNMQGGQQGHAAYHVHAQLRTAWRALARHRSAPLWPTDPLRARLRPSRSMSCASDGEHATIGHRIAACSIARAA